MENKVKKSEDVSVYELYMKDIRRYGDIDSKKTNELINVYRTGSVKERKLAKERIVGSHQRYVLSIANKFAHKDNLMDIISEGNIGLMRAIEEYDLDSSTKFTTYAMYWVRKAIMSYMTNKEPMVVPKNAIKLVTYVPKICQDFWNKNYRQPTTDEIQDILLEKYNLNFTNKCDIASFQSVSIDEKYDVDDDGQEFMESSSYTSKTAKCDTDSFVSKYDANVIVQNILSKVNDRDAYIIKSVYGINCTPKSMEEISEEVGVGYERVRQIAVNSVKELGKKYKDVRYSF